MVDSELAMLDATSQADLVRSGEVSALELVDAAIARLEALNPALNAVIHPSFDRARERAAGLVPEGPFRGVPFVVKDLIAHAKGEPFHEGIKGIAAVEFREDRDTDLVRRFADAGLVTLGRTNTSELGLMPTTEPTQYGPTHNPWDLNRSPLGSGGGSAAAVAAGIVPVAHSNDGGGSIRLPAAACGQIGLKPTRGRVSLGPDFGDLISGTVCEFAITRSVRDTAALFAAVSGPGVGDPYAPALEPASRRTPVRVGVMFDAPAGACPVHSACRQAVERTARTLEGLGCSVDESHPAALDDIEFGRYATKIIPFAFAAFALSWWQRRTGIELGPDDVEPWTWTCAELGRAISAPEYLSAVEYVQAWTRRLSQWWHDDFDLLLTPTLPEPPPLLGSFDAGPDNPYHAGLRSAEIVAFTYPFNHSGHPAISLPGHFDNGLPIGVQLVAAHGHEELLLDVAGQLEQAERWNVNPPTRN